LAQYQQRRGGGRPRRGAPTRRPKPNLPPIEPLHPTENPPEIECFRELPLDELVQATIARMGIVKPTPIQALAIEPVLKGRDIIAKAETGTGKTLAFGAPMMSMIDAQRASVLGLVLTPTRELAEQVAKVLEQLGEPRGLKVALIVGGEPAGPQVAALQAGAQVVVGTPGRVIDLYEQKFLSFPWTEFVVLDEADEMLEIGFIDDVKKILRFTPDERQTLLFSATFPDALLRLARDYTNNPKEVATASGVKTVDTIKQSYFQVDDTDRPLALIRMIEQAGDDDCFLVFCERRTEVERLLRRLERLPYSIKALHGGYDQSSRFRVMSAFREGDVKALIATDVASRGLDVNHVTHVVNYSVPRSVTDYTHRIGRTGRAGREGNAITLVSPEQARRWKGVLSDATWTIERCEAPERGPRQAERRPRDRGRVESGRREERGAGRDERGSRGRHEERAGSRREERRPLRREESQRTERPASSDGGDDPISLPTNREHRQRSADDPPRRARSRGELSPERREEEHILHHENDARPRRDRTTSEERGRREGRPRNEQRSSGEERPQRAQSTREARAQERDQVRSHPEPRESEERREPQPKPQPTRSQEASSEPKNAPESGSSGSGGGFGVGL